MRKAWPCVLAKVLDEQQHRNALAPDRDRAALEAETKFPLPDSWVALLGALTEDPSKAANLGEFRWLSFSGALEIWTLHLALAQIEEIDASLASSSDARIRRVVYDSRRLPIADYNGDLWLCLDFDPTSIGESGQVILVDPEGLSWRWIAKNFDELLLDISRGNLLICDGPDHR